MIDDAQKKIQRKRGAGAKSSAVRVIERLVLKAMAGKHNVLGALRSYVRGEAGPAVLSHRYGVTKYQLRGFMQSLRNKVGSTFEAERYVSMFVDHAMKIPSAVNGDRTVCRICGRVLVDIYPEDHFLKSHKSEVRVWVMFIANEYRKTRGTGGGR